MFLDEVIYNYYHVDVQKVDIDSEISGAVQCVCLYQFIVNVTGHHPIISVTSVY